MSDVELMFFVVCIVILCVRCFLNLCDLIVLMVNYCVVYLVGVSCSFMKLWFFVFVMCRWGFVVWSCLVRIVGGNGRICLSLGEVMEVVLNLMLN